MTLGRKGGGRGSKKKDEEEKKRKEARWEVEGLEGGILCQSIEREDERK